MPTKNLAEEDEFSKYEVTQPSKMKSSKSKSEPEDEFAKYEVKNYVPLAEKYQEEPMPEQASYGGTALRAAANAVPDLLYWPLKKIFGKGIISPEEYSKQRITEPGDKYNPYSQVAGGLLGGGPELAAENKALRMLPGYKNIVEKAAPKLSTRVPLRAAEFGAQGAVHAPPGEEGKAATIGAGLGVLAEALPAAGKFTKEKYENLKHRINEVKNIDELDKAAAEAVKGYENYKENEAPESVAARTRANGPKAPGAVKGDLGTLEKEHKELQTAAEDLQKEINTTKDYNTTNLLPGASGHDIVPRAEANLEKMKGLEEKAKKGLQEDLYHGAEHDIEITNSLLEKAAANKKEIGDIYQDVNKSFAKKKVQVPNSPQNQLLYDELVHKISTEGVPSPLMGQVLEQLKKSKMFTQIPADQYLDHYRTVRDLGHEKLQEASSWKTSANDSRKLRAEAKQYRLLAEKMYKILESSVNKKDFAKLENARNRYKNEVVPLFKNKVFNGMQRNEQGASGGINFMQNLRGSGKGQEILRNMITSDPELLKHVVGQKFAANPHKLHEPNATLNTYLQHMPELKAKIAQHGRIKDSIKRAESNIQKAKSKKEAIDIEKKRIEDAFSEKVGSNALKQKMKDDLIKMKEKINDKEIEIHKFKAHLKQVHDYEKLMKEKLDGIEGNSKEALSKRAQYKAELKRLKEEADRISERAKAARKYKDDAWSKAIKLAKIIGQPAAIFLGIKLI